MFGIGRVVRINAENDPVKPDIESNIVKYNLKFEFW